MTDSFPLGSLDDNLLLRVIQAVPFEIRDCDTDYWRSHGEDVLKQLKQRVALERVSQRFQRVTRASYDDVRTSECFNVLIDPEKPRWSLEALLDRIGRSLRVNTLCGLSGALWSPLTGPNEMALVGQKCPVLESWTLNVRDVEHLLCLPEMASLKKLELHFPPIRDWEGEKRNLTVTELGDRLKQTQQTRKLSLNHLYIDAYNLPAAMKPLALQAVCLVNDMKLLRELKLGGISNLDLGFLAEQCNGQKLEQLELHGCGPTGDLENLVSANTVSLRIDNCTNVQRLISRLGASLRNCDLGSSKLNDDALISLLNRAPQMEQLRLSHCDQLTTKSTACLGQIATMQHLCLRDCSGIDRAVIEAIAAGCPNLEHAQFVGPQISRDIQLSGSILVALSEMKKLKFLEIEGQSKDYVKDACDKRTACIKAGIDLPILRVSAFGEPFMQLVAPGSPGPRLVLEIKMPECSMHAPPPNPPFPDEELIAPELN